MTKILVIHGAGMSMRGKAQMEVFGPMTLPEYDAAIVRCGRLSLLAALRRRAPRRGGRPPRCR